MPDPTQEDQDQWVANRKIRFLMQNNHLTVQRLAELLGITRNSLQQIVDEQAQATDTMIHKVARHFNVQPEFFNSELAASRKSSVNVPLLSHEVSIASSTAASKITKTKGNEPLNLKGLAVRYQALIELLVQKGTITAKEYREMIEQVEGR